MTARLVRKDWTKREPSGWQSEGVLICRQIGGQLKEAWAVCGPGGRTGPRGRVQCNWERTHPKEEQFCTALAHCSAGGRERLEGTMGV